MAVKADVMVTNPQRFHEFMVILPRKKTLKLRNGRRSGNPRDTSAGNHAGLPTTVAGSPGKYGLLPPPHRRLTDIHLPEGTACSRKCPPIGRRQTNSLKNAPWAWQFMLLHQIDSDAF